VADRIVVMNEGRKVLEGTPADVLFGNEAEAYGVAVPAVTQVQKMLARDGVLLRRELMTPAELAAEVGGTS
jgi:ABC-type hemin transport system ATPase subunit